MPALDVAYIDALNEAIDDAWRIGTKQFGFDPFPINFEIMPASVIYEIASYGMPGRFTHWSFGKSYNRQKVTYDYGLGKIYELIINTDPCQAFLLDTNTLVTNKFVVAHCIGHSDFFKNNAYFNQTNRAMADTMGINAERMHQYEFDHGRSIVEPFIDAILSIDFYVDPAIGVPDLSTPPKPRERPPGTDYDDLWTIGLPVDDSPRWVSGISRRPREPIGDLLLFIAEFAPRLEDWQRDIIMMLRGEALYFIPQMRTKIINEGWACVAHSRIMREMDLDSSEHLEFARLHSLITNVNRSSINPYHLGYMILEDIERRFGFEKLLEVREVENDVSLVRNYLTEELFHEADLYIYEKIGTDWLVTNDDYEAVQGQLLNQLITFGRPRISVVDGDYKQNMELYLAHHWDGYPLDHPYMVKTMEYLYQLWGRTVWLETRLDPESPIAYRIDEDGITEQVVKGEYSL